MTGKAEISPADYLTGEVYRRPSSMSVTYHPGMAVIRRATIADSGEGDPHVPQDGLAQDNQGYELGTSKENLTYFN